MYSAPLKEDLIGQRVEEIKKSGAKCAVSVTPANTKRLAPIAVEAGADILFVQSTVTTARHTSKSYKGLIFSELMETIKEVNVNSQGRQYSVANLHFGHSRHKCSNVDPPIKRAVVCLTAG